MPAHGTRLWTDAEDKRLLRMYREGYEPKIMAEAFGRSAQAISDRRRKLLSEECATR